MPTLEGYPVILPTNTRCRNFIFNGVSLNANYDITWSFEYSLSGLPGMEGGFVTFLTAQQSLTGGNVGIDLGYSGLSTTSSFYTDVASYSNTGTLTSTTYQGVLCAIVGVGFDTTGLFALSGKYNDETTRAGIGLQSVSANSLIIRGSYPNYPLLYNQQLSSLSTNIQLVSSNTFFTKIRCRLGNVGRTLYVDHKPTGSLNYKNLVTLPITLPIIDTTKYYVGMSFSSPVSTFDAAKTCVLQIKNFHVEGRYDTAADYSIIGASIGDNTVVPTEPYNLVTELNTLSTIVPPTSGVQDVNLENGSLITPSSDVIYVDI